MKILPQPCHSPTVVCSNYLQAAGCIADAILVYIPMLRGVHVYSQCTTICNATSLAMCTLALCVRKHFKELENGLQFFELDLPHASAIKQQLVEKVLPNAQKVTTSPPPPPPPPPPPRPPRPRCLSARWGDLDQTNTGFYLKLHACIYSSLHSTCATCNTSRHVKLSKP